MIGSRTHAERGCGSGYSLAELIIALGVLAVGLSMVATAFLAGAAENSESIQDTMGTLVAENALAVVRARVRNADLMRPAPDGFGTARMSDPKLIPDSLVDMVDLEWDPDRHVDHGGQPHKSGLYGCVVLVQRLADDRNDYRLIAIPFRKFKDNNTFKDVDVDVNSSGMVTKHKVMLEDPDAGASDQPTESADIGLLVYRTGLRS